jgi:2-polyprenyl-3-methyl-5-hydroxy-6-metoxy-1,4-benzoquinol methylase
MSRHRISGKEAKLLQDFLERRVFDPRLEKLVLAYIEKVSGKKWRDEAVLEKLRNAIVIQKNSYWKEGEKKQIRYKGAYSVLGYMAYQMPVYVAGFSEIFIRLIRDGLIRDHIRVLDVGAGPGTVTAALAGVLALTDGMTAEVTALEPSEIHREAYLAVAKAFAAAAGGKVTADRLIAEDVLHAEPAGEFDLIVCANVINELALPDTAAKTDLLMKLSRNLSKDGNLILMEPADLVNAAELRDISRGLKEKGMTLYAPCNDLRGVPCRVSPCWTFTSCRDIRPTKLMSALGGTEEKYRFVNTDVKFSCAVLRKDGHRKCGYKIPAEAKRARLSQLRKHTGRRIHVTVSVMSEDIGDAKTYLYLVCDGSGDTQSYAALPAHHRKPVHEALLSARYGSVVAIDSVLVRYNENRNSYNLLLGPDSLTRLIAGVPGTPAPDKLKALKEKYGGKKPPAGKRT